MANLSNINNILRTNSTGVGIFDDAVSYPLEISSATTAGMRLINTAGATYDVYGNTSEEFLITKVGVGERLKIASGGAITFNNAYTFPTAVTTTNNYVLTAQTDGSTAWAAEGSTGTVKGTGTATRVAFWSASDTISSDADLYWDNTNKRLGIGTSSPTVKLYIKGDSDTNSEFLIIEDSDSTAGSITPKIQFRSASAAIGSIRAHDVRGLQLGGGTNTQDLTIDPSGNVGIGTTSPACILNIEDSVASTSPATDANNLLLIENTNAAGSCNIRLRGGDGATRIMYGHNVTADDKLYITPRANDNPVIFDGSGNVEVSGNITIHDSSNAPYIDFVESGATSDSKARITMDQVDTDNGQLIFSTEGSGTLTERMRIDSSGNVGIGTTNPLSKLTVSEGTDQHGIELAPGTLSYLQCYDRATSTYGNMTIDAKYLAFGLDNGAEKIRFTADGDVGIGTTSPDELLHLYKASGNTGLEIEAVSSGDPIIRFVSANNRTGDIFYTDATTLAKFSYDHSAQAFKTYAHNNTTVDFYLSETEAYFPSQDVGIGTTSPIEKLQVAGQIISTASNSTSATAGAERAIMDLSGYTATDHSARFGHFRGATAAGAGQMRLYTDSVERVRIDASGNVGIGTTSPDSPLEVVGPTTKTNLGTVSNQTITCSGGGGVGEYNQIGFGYTAGDWSPAVIGYVTTNGAGSTLGALIFAARNSTTAMAPTERMRITSDGKVGIGTTSPGNQLQVSTGIGIGTTIGRNYLNGTLANGANIVLNANSSGGNNSAGFIAVSCVPNFASTGGAVGLWTGLHTQGANIYTLISQRDENGITIAESGGQFTVTNNSGSTAYYQLKVLNITDFASTVYGI